MAELLTEQPVILDCGMAIDDFMTLLYLAKAAELMAVSVTGVGEAAPRSGAKNAARLLKLADEYPIPIGIGPEASLSGDHRFPSYLATIVGTMLFVPRPRVDDLEIADSVEMMAEQISNAAQKVSLVVTGPATNIGMLVQNHPDVLSNIREIVMMAGAIRVDGNSHDFGDKKLNPAVEWNVLVDPLATQLVLESGVPVTLVPLDATNAITLNKAMYEKLTADQSNPVAKFTSTYLHRLMVMSRLAGKPLPLWDPATAAVTINPGIAEFENMHIRVVVDENDRDFGRTVIDKDGPEVRVCVQIDPERFAQEMVDKLTPGES